MSSADRSRWRKGTWRAAVLLPVAAVMVSHSFVPVRAGRATPRPAAPATTTHVARPPKEEKGKKDGGSIPEMIEQVFGPRADEALRIAHCESKYRPDAVSSAGAVGVFQIRPRLHGWRVKEVDDGKDLRDPRTNIRVAYSLMKDQGWTPWVCARLVGITRSRVHAARYVKSSPRREATPRVPRQPRMARWVP